MRFRLIPRDEGFYPLLEQQAAHAAGTALQLEQLMKSLPVLDDRTPEEILDYDEHGLPR